MATKPVALFAYVQGPASAGPQATPTGSSRFEQARTRLARIATLEPEQVRDVDVLEFLALGEVATKEYLAAEAKCARA